MDGTATGGRNETTRENQGPKKQPQRKREKVAKPVVGKPRNRRARFCAPVDESSQIKNSDLHGIVLALPDRCGNSCRSPSQTEACRSQMFCFCVCHPISAPEHPLCAKPGRSTSPCAGEAAGRAAQWAKANDKTAMSTMSLPSLLCAWDCPTETAVWQQPRPQGSGTGHATDVRPAPQ